MTTVWLVNYAAIPYGEALALQHRIVEGRKRGRLNDTLLLLEHPPVFTLGRNGNESNILASPDFLKGLGIEVYRVERGGDVTYHGPNQLVGYPILDLRNFRQDVGWFVHSIEEVLIRALAEFQIEAWQIDKLIGVWVRNPAMSDCPSSVDGLPVHLSHEAKIAQIGARIENWVTYHGFALNVDPNLAHFDLIVPCGISDKAVTSMARVLNHPVQTAAVRQCVAARFAEVFEAELIEIPPDEFEVRLRAAEAE
jgi:lipoate-protein ligase B